MAATLVFLAGLLATPTVDVAFSRRVQQRYPTWAVRDGQQTAYAVELTVQPDGTVAACRVVEAVGSARLAAETCAGTVGLKLAPATDSNGVAVYGMLQTVITMTVSGGRGTSAIRAFSPAPDVELQVDRLPRGSEHLDLEVALLVSPEGQVTECEGRETKTTPLPAATFVTAACEQAKSWRGRVLQDTSGAALPYVTNLRIRFGRSSAPAEG